jgi:tRNA nucleotidyltransferase (CCA-adding enzyme)
MNASKWRPPISIDMEGYYEKGEAAKKFAGQPLVFIDAIDRNRNVAAAVSETNVYKFIALCQNLLANPGEEALFFAKPPEMKEIRSKLEHLRKAGVVERLQEKLGGKHPASAWRAARIILLKFSKPDLVEDILYPQLEKTTTSIRRHLELNDFKLLAATSFTDGKNAYVLLVFPTLERSAIVRVSGPPANDAVAVKKFLKNHENAIRGPFIEGNKVFVEETRQGNNAIEFLKRGAANPESFGIASYLKNPIKKAVLLLDDDILNLGDEAVRELHDFFFKKEFR